MGWFGKEIVDVVVKCQFQVKGDVVRVVVNVVWQINKQWVIGVNDVFLLCELCFQMLICYCIVQKQCVGVFIVDKEIVWIGLCCFMVLFNCYVVIIFVFYDCYVVVMQFCFFSGVGVGRYMYCYFKIDVGVYDID